MTAFKSERQIPACSILHLLFFLGLNNNQKPMSSNSLNCFTKCPLRADTQTFCNNLMEVLLRLKVGTGGTLVLYCNTQALMVADTELLEISVMFFIGKTCAKRGHLCCC